jgi:aldehyde dehydrogenase (NAD+)
MNEFQEMFDRQKALFASGRTRGHAWRIEQLDRMAKMISENESALQNGHEVDTKRTQIEGSWRQTKRRTLIGSW